MSETDRVKAGKIKKARRKIIDLLKLWSPDAVSFGEIGNTLADVPTDLLIKDIDALIKDGYVVRVGTEPNEPWDKREFELTGDGIRIADRINVDPNLEP